MTEAEWLKCTDPTPMLEFLTEQASERKLRLFGVACCRRLWHLLDEDHCKKLVEVGLPLGCRDLPDLPLDSCRRAIEMAEQATDEPVSAEELRPLLGAPFVRTASPAAFAETAGSASPRVVDHLFAVRMSALNELGSILS